MTPSHTSAAFAFLLAACAAAPRPAWVRVDPHDPGKTDGVESTKVRPWRARGPFARVESLDLQVDIAALRGRAVLRLEPTEAASIQLDAVGLEIQSLTVNGVLVEPVVREGELVLAGDFRAPAEVVAEYTFRIHGNSDGLLANGSTVLWPYYCGNLFPCNPDPLDGIRFTLGLDGVADGLSAIAPEAVDAEVPSYTVAWAVGRYECQELGATRAGTDVRVCWLPRGKNRALEGSRDLVAFMDFYEKTLGPYTLGSEVGSVSVDWGPSAAGGMEHHPFWHLARDEMNLPLTHAHEAAHGWYGTGVRVACWEDFVLSEGTVSYLTARAIGAVSGPEAEQAVWDDYANELAVTLETENILAWPEGCGQVDILQDGLFSNIVYMKGAFFFRAVAERVDVERLDAILAAFYRARVGTAARMQELIDFIESEAQTDVDDLVAQWLRGRS